jgi:hypothetical protein
METTNRMHPTIVLGVMHRREKWQLQQGKEITSPSSRTNITTTTIDVNTVDFC